MVKVENESHHKSKPSDNSRSVAMRGIPTVRMPVLTLFTKSTRDRTVMTINDRPFFSTTGFDSITCMLMAELGRL